MLGGLHGAHAMDTVQLDTVLLGTGLLGEAIGQRLLQQGHRLTVWNRSPGRCQGLLEAEAGDSSGLELLGRR